MQQPKDSKKIISIISYFLSEAGLKPKGITSLTVGVDRRSLSGSFIFNADTKEMYAQYPGYYKNCRGQQIRPIYKELGGIHWTINFITNLQSINLFKNEISKKSNQSYS